MFWDRFHPTDAANAFLAESPSDVHSIDIRTLASSDGTF